MYPHGTVLVTEENFISNLYKLSPKFEQKLLESAKKTMG